LDSITEAELLEELRAALGDPGPDDAYTSAEIAELLACSVETARTRIKPLILAGRMSPVKVQRRRMDGQMQRVSAYRLAAK
jgi:hypothetical protein